MPHYKDGTPARLGDLVKGELFRTGGPITGTIAQLAAHDSETMNCMVVFVKDHGASAPPQGESVRAFGKPRRYFSMQMAYGSTHALELLWPVAAPEATR